MEKPIRKVLFVFLLVISLALLVWGFWPGETMIKTLPIPPLDMQLPTPTSLWLVVKVLV